MKKKEITRTIICIMLTIVMTMSCGLMTGCGDSGKDAATNDTQTEAEDENYEDYDGESEEDYEDYMDYTLSEALKSEEYSIWYHLYTDLGDTAVAKNQSFNRIYVFDQQKEQATIYSNPDGLGQLGDCAGLTNEEVKKVLKKMEDMEDVEIETIPYTVHVYTDDSGNEVEREEIEFEGHYDYNITYEEDVFGEVYDSAFKGVGIYSGADQNGTASEVVSQTDNEDPFIFDDTDTEGVVVD